MSDLKKWQSTLAKVACVLPDTAWFEEALTILAELEAARRVVEAARRFQIEAWDTHMFTDFGLSEALTAYDLARKGEE